MVVFDLDDTLYKEHHYVLSGYDTVARRVAASAGLSPRRALARMLAADDAIAEAAAIGSITEKQAVAIYRGHMPSISLSTDALALLTELHRRGVPMAIITDGRARAQRNKHLALGLRHFIPTSRLLISEETGAEKTEPLPFRRLMDMCPPGEPLVYIGDNPAKDFLHPRALGWRTIMLRDILGENIHPQTAPPCPEAEAEAAVDYLAEAIPLLEDWGIIPRSDAPATSQTSQPQ